MNTRKVIVWAVCLLLVAFLGWKLHSIHFDWAGFWAACRDVKWPMVAVAAGIIWAGALLRAVRWALFLKPSQPEGQRTPWWSLIGAQYIGFAGLAAFGRIGELIRPYLISKRTGLPFSSQVAVVAVERIFDLAAFGLIFGGNLIVSSRLLDTLPYHEKYPLIGYAVAGVTVFLILFVLAVRLAGATVAKLAGSLVGMVSKKGGQYTAEKILEFRDGLDTVGSARDFIFISLLSIALWASIAVAYVVALRALPPPAHDLTLAHSLLLMGFSAVGGLVQLPGVGGGAQALTIGALTKLFHVPLELATSAGFILYFVTTLGFILPGLVAAQLERVSLLGAARAGRAERDRAALLH